MYVYKYLSTHVLPIEESGSASAIVPPTMLLESLQELLECAQEMRHSEVCMYVCMYACKVLQC